ncbi:MAG: hypothetical protein SF066_15365 [Thermoanaerobaculia bacterium]|nr:hypothetical protein [Thermoanaerobaculia bacterium]
MAEKKAYPLRIDPDVYDALKRWADDELRSVNGQIEYLLTQALKKAGRGRKGKAGLEGPEPRDERAGDEE